MKKLIIAMAAALALANLAATTALAQTANSKTELAARVVALQQGRELDRLVTQLAGSTSQELIAIWAPKLAANVPKAKQQKASEDMNAELKKYADDANQLIAKQVKKVSADVLVPAYADRFTQEELQQIAAFFESPVIKKYQAAAPELGSIFIQKLVEASRADVLARARQFDDAALQIVGSPQSNEPKASKQATSSDDSTPGLPSTHPISTAVAANGCPTTLGRLDQTLPRFNNADLQNARQSIVSENVLAGIQRGKAQGYSPSQMATKLLQDVKGAEQEEARAEQCVQQVSTGQSGNNIIAQVKNGTYRFSNPMSVRDSCAASIALQNYNVSALKESALAVACHARSGG